MQESDVRALLEATGLPSADLNAEKLECFCGTYRNGRLAGIVGVEPHGREALLRSLAVLPEYRAQGLGKALVSLAENLAAAGGAESVWLLTVGAQRFFERLGYASVPRESAPHAIQATSEFSSLCPASAALMRKSLQHSGRA